MRKNEPFNYTHSFDCVYRNYVRDYSQGISRLHGGRMMESLIMIGIGNLLLILIVFAFTQMHLKDINDKNRINMNGISHVWGALMELKLDLKLLEGEEE